MRRKLREKGRTEGERGKNRGGFLPPFFGLFSGFLLSLSISLYLYIYLYYTEKRVPLIRFLRKKSQTRIPILEGATGWWGHHAQVAGGLCPLRPPNLYRFEARMQLQHQTHSRFDNLSHLRVRCESPTAGDRSNVLNLTTLSTDRGAGMAEITLSCFDREGAVSAAPNALIRYAGPIIPGGLAYKARVNSRYQSHMGQAARLALLCFGALRASWPQSAKGLGVAGGKAPQTTFNDNPIIKVRSNTPMTVKYYVDPKGSHLIFEVEAETSKEIFRKIAEIEETFEGDNACGRCKSAWLRHRVRAVDKNEFFELVCGDCGSTLALGQTKDGTRLYPKRDGANRGWKEAYNKEPEYEGARR